MIVLANDLIENYRHDYAKAGFTLTRQNKKIVIEGNDLKIEGKADNTLWTGLDVLCKQDYFFEITESYIMIDIGFNLGMTSLFFARNENVKNIYGFEPFIPTYKQGLRNVKLNPKYGNKIKVYPYGLGDKNQSLKFKYNPDKPGAMSSVREVFLDGNKFETIRIRKSSSIIKRIVAKHPNEKIFLKIDCEGAEGNILSDLDKNNVLDDVDVIIMEWHYEPPTKLISILKKHNFFLFNNHVVTNELGMIRAIRL